MIGGPLSKEPRLIASVLGTDYTRLGDEVSALVEAGANSIQWDIMDGVFVPAITFGADVVEACRPVVDVPFEAHLMVVQPDRHIAAFLDAGCETVIVHAETTRDLPSAVAAIRGLGGRAGIALNPATPLSEVGNETMALLDQILIMTVEPGASGQTYRSDVETKIRETRRLLHRSRLDVSIEVDGGITPISIIGARQAGADTFVSGSWVLGHPQGKTAALDQLAKALSTLP